MTENRIEGLESEVLDIEVPLFTVRRIEEDHAEGLAVYLLSVNALSRRLHPSLAADYLVTVDGDQLSIVPYDNGHIGNKARVFNVASLAEAQTQLRQYLFGEFFCPF